MLQDSNGIWLYFNKKGSPISKIAHGNSIRQGSSFRLIYAFEDSSMIVDKDVLVAFKKPGDATPSLYQSVGKITQSDLGSSTKKVKFTKIKSNEMTYGLNDNQEYYGFSEIYPSTQGITEKYGNLTVLVKIVSKEGSYIDGIDTDFDGASDNEEKDDIVFYQGAVQLYIEPTYGKLPDTSNISLSQAEALARKFEEGIAGKVDEIDGSMYGEMNAKTYYTTNELGQKAKSTTTTDSKTHIKVHAPENDDDAANKGYVVAKESGTANNLTMNGNVNAEGAIIKVPDLTSSSDNKQVANKGYVVAKESGTANNLTMTGNIDATANGTYIKVNEPTNNFHAVNKKYIDDTKVSIVNGTLKGNVNAEEAIIKVPNLTTNSNDTQVVNKKYVNDTLAKYTYSDDSDTTQLKRNGVNINPKTTASNVTIGNTDLEAKISDINSKIDSTVRFKGYYSSVNDIPEGSYTYGDYVVITRTGEDDLLYIWDTDKQAWIEKGQYNTYVRTVNGVEPDDNKNIQITANDINYKTDTTIKSELDSLGGKITTLNQNALKFKQTWNAANTYNKSDIVIYDKDLYVCKNDETSSSTNPKEDTTNWEIFAQGFSGDYNELINKPYGLEDFSNETTKFVNEDKLAEEINKVKATIGTVDDEMSDTSTNAVQNKVIKAYVDNNVPDVSSQINTHNSSETAHPYILGLLPTVTKLGD